MRKARKKREKKEKMSLPVQVWGDVTEDEWLPFAEAICKSAIRGDLQVEKVPENERVLSAYQAPLHGGFGIVVRTQWGGLQMIVWPATTINFSKLRKEWVAFLRERAKERGFSPNDQLPGVDVF